MLAAARGDTDAALYELVRITDLEDAECRFEAGRTGLRPSTGLTETERRVAEQVAAGRSNQEAADELFISTKTVEANLTWIHRKLTVRSRTELAARLSSHPTDLPEGSRRSTRSPDSPRAPTPVRP